MFFREALRLRLPASVARERLQRLCEDHELAVASHRALDQPQQAGAHVTPSPPDKLPADSARPHDQLSQAGLIIHHLPSSARGTATVVSLRWFRPNDPDRPVLDADLELEPTDNGGSVRLRLIGLLNDTTEDPSIDDNPQTPITLHTVRRFLTDVAALLRTP